LKFASYNQQLWSSSNLAFSRALLCDFFFFSCHCFPFINKQINSLSPLEQSDIMSTIEEPENPMTADEVDQVANQSTNPPNEGATEMDGE
jgi:hypothetical protein